MFAPYCATHGSRILLGYESVVDVEQTAFGPQVLLRCHCGTLLTHSQRQPADVQRPAGASHIVDTAGRDAGRTAH
jgi:hypothetical protein